MCSAIPSATRKYRSTGDRTFTLQSLENLAQNISIAVEQGACTPDEGERLRDILEECTSTLERGRELTPLQVRDLLKGLADLLRAILYKSMNK